MDNTTYDYNRPLDAVALACLRKAHGLRAEVGHDPMALAAAGLALALIEAAEGLQARSRRRPRTAPDCWTSASI